MAAKNKGTANTAAAADSGTGTDAGTATTTPKTGRGRSANPEATIYWNGARDTALMLLLLQNPGRLTTAQVADRLAADPAFSDEAHLMKLPSTPDKIRQRVVKLNADSEELGHGQQFQLKRMNNSGYDRASTVAAVLAGQAKAPVAQPQAPAFDGGVPLVAPAGPVQAQAPQQFLANTAGATGGLIPTPQ